MRILNMEKMLRLNAHFTDKKMLRLNAHFTYRKIKNRSTTQLRNQTTFFRETRGNRTPDNLIKSQVLYQLS